MGKIKKCIDCKKKLASRNKTGYCRKCLDENRKGIGGAPTKMTKDILDKLEHAFAIGANDQEACFFAEISKDVLYNYIQRNPKFYERKESLKKKPVLLAKANVVKKLKMDDIDTSKWYLERRCRDEFATKTIGENTNSHMIGILSEKQKRAQQEILRRETGEDTL